MPYRYLKMLPVEIDLARGTILGLLSVKKCSGFSPSRGSREEVEVREWEYDHILIIVKNRQKEAAFNVPILIEDESYFRRAPECQMTKLKEGPRTHLGSTSTRIMRSSIGLRNLG